MAKRYENINRYLIIQFDSDLEMGICGFGDICCKCGQHCQEFPMFYVSVLSDMMCKSCVDKYVVHQFPHPEDREIEEHRYNRVKNWLGRYFLEDEVI